MKDVPVAGARRHPAVQPPREDTRDAWISPSGKLPQELPDGT